MADLWQEQREARKTSVEPLPHRMRPKSLVLMPTSLHCTPTLLVEALLPLWWLWAAYAQLQKLASEPPGLGRGGHGEGLGGP